MIFEMSCSGLNSNYQNLLDRKSVLSIVLDFFLRGQDNESCNLIGSKRSPYFPISTHGHGNAFLSHREHP